MKEISEDKWVDAIQSMRSRLDELVMREDVDFREMFDCEITIKLLEAGLKSCRDAKNNI